MGRSSARPGQRRLRRWLEAGVDLVFPPRCVGCGRRGQVWCPTCEQSLCRLEGGLCVRCGAALGGAMGCSLCRARPFPLTARSFALYDGPLARAIVSLKYRPNRALARVMAGWLGEVCRREGWRPTLVVPVPLGRDRLRRRGYNQASLIASALADRLGLPMEDSALRRVRETRSQVGLDPASRLANVQGAFQADPGPFQGKHVLLVDDLFTTGATLAACAEALMDVGAEQVHGITVGRAR